MNNDENNEYSHGELSSGGWAIAAVLAVILMAIVLYPFPA